MLSVHLSVGIVNVSPCAFKTPMAARFWPANGLLALTFTGPTFTPVMRYVLLRGMAPEYHDLLTRPQVNCPSFSNRSDDNRISPPAMNALSGGSMVPVTLPT